MPEKENIILFKNYFQKAIVQKMEEENKVNSYLVNEKYPREIESYKAQIKNAEIVASKSIMSQAEINDIKKQVDSYNLLFNVYFPLFVLELIMNKSLD